jgi:hypothetical protein
LNKMAIGWDWTEEDKEKEKKEDSLLDDWGAL